MLSTVHINEVLLLSEKMLIHEGFQKTVDSFLCHIHQCVDYCLSTEVMRDDDIAV